MPSKDRVRGAVVEVSEVLAGIGYTTVEVVGPVDGDGDQLSEAELEEAQEIQYYLVGEGEKSLFHINFSTSLEYATIVYPMDVLNHLGRRLEHHEVEAIIGETIDWENAGDEVKDKVARRAAEHIVNNSELISIHRAAFSLSAYASTAFVEYHQRTSEHGFPVEFQCTRGLFPYTKEVSLSELDDRVHPVVIAGERGRRFVEYSLHIDKSGAPEEYSFKTLF